MNLKSDNLSRAQNTVLSCLTPGKLISVSVQSHVRVHWYGIPVA